MKHSAKLFSAITCAVLLAGTAVLAASCGPEENDPVDPPAPVYYTVTADYEKAHGSVVWSDAQSEKGYVLGEEVMVTVTPNPHYEVDTFTVNDTAAELTAGTNSFHVEQNTVICAVFVPEEVELTLDFDEAQGTVAVENAKDVYHYGDEITVVVTAKNGYQLTSFTVNGEAKELTDGKYTFTLTGNTTVAAAFEAEEPAPPQTVTVTADFDKTLGTVTLSAPADGKAYVEGETVTVTVAANAHYVVSSFTVNGKEEALTQGVYTFKATEDTAIQVVFAPEEVRLTLDFDKTQGSVSVENAKDVYHYGDEITVVVAPESGKQVKSFTVNGEETYLTNGKYNLTLDGDTTVAVVFEDETLVIDAYYHGIFEGTRNGTTYRVNITESGVSLKIDSAEYQEGTVTEYSYSKGITFTVGADKYEIAKFADNAVVLYLPKGQVNCMRVEEKDPDVDPEIPELSIPEKLHGVWETAERDHKLTITATALTLDGKSATAFISEDYFGVVLYQFAIGDDVYSMTYSNDKNTLSVLLPDEKTNIIFTIRDGEEVKPNPVVILPGYVGKFSGPDDSTDYIVVITAEGITVTIGEAEPVKAELVSYVEVRGYTIRLGEKEYRINKVGNDNNVITKIDFYYGSSILDYVRLSRVTEGGSEPDPDEPSFNIGSDWQGTYVGMSGNDIYCVTITQTTVTIQINFDTFVGVVTDYDIIDGITFQIGEDVYRITSTSWASPLANIVVHLPNGTTVTCTR